MKICEQPGCGRPHYARNQCNRHYQALRKYGDASAARDRCGYRTSPVEKLEFAGWVVNDAGCWIPNLHTNAKGYAVTWGGSSKLAHRVAYSAWVGPIPEGHVVRHKCDNPPCINPEHLETGTQADNVADMIERGRLAVGERRTTAKLTETEIREIRKMYDTGFSQTHIMSQFPQVSKSSIYAASTRRSWKHLKD